jgi:hypothetical protein
MSMSGTEQIDTFRTTTSAPSTVSNHGFKWLGVRKEVGSDPTSTGTEINLKRKLKQKERKVPAQDPISTKNCLKREEVGSDQTSTGTEIKNEIPAGAILGNVSEKKVKQEKRDKFRWGLAVAPKYLVREMKPLTWSLQASNTRTSTPRTSIRPKDLVLCSMPCKTDSELGGPDAKQWLGECEIIRTNPGISGGGYDVKWLWHENTDFDINSKDTWINEKDIRYVLVKDGTCLHQDPLWRSALEIVVRSPFLSSLFPSSS